MEESTNNLENNNNSLGTLKIESLDNSNNLDIESKTILEKPKDIYLQKIISACNG